jgi:cytochrome o ubiquinol oxidase subunit 2
VGKRILKILIFALLVAIIVEWVAFFLEKKDFLVLQPKGWIAWRERDLIFVSLLLMCIVVIPAIVMTVVFAWKYRASNPEAKYRPDWDNNVLIEAIWWGVPCLIILILSIVTWRSSHELDPWRPLSSEEPPLTIQTVALRWKWLFLYPEQGIAAVNFVQFPEKVPLHFEITADAPMNSFWIPQLGGQIYAMAGMKTELHLIADEAGEFRGGSANLSGEGFSGMSFMAKASSRQAFEEWANTVRKTAPTLTRALYEETLLPPSEYHPIILYRLEDPQLFEEIVHKPMHIPNVVQKLACRLRQSPWIE